MTKAITGPSFHIATWFRVGLLPKMPGTWASLVTLPLAFFLHAVSHPFLYLFVVLALLVIGWAATNQVLKTPGLSKDPSFIVIDEVVGQLVALFFIPAFFADHLGWFYAGGFVLFRLFDIWKPYPISRLERLEGWPALSVMADDVGAGLLAALVLSVIGRVV